MRWLPLAGLAVVAGCVGSPCPAGTVRGGDDDCVDAFVGDPVPHDDVVRPAPGASWQVQLDGVVDTTVAAEVVDVDLFELTDEVADALTDAVLVCYLSAGSWETWRPDADDYPREALGLPLKGWPGERWVDVMDGDVRDVLEARLELAVRKGCDAVDPDNVDGWTTQTGFPITADEALDFVRFLADAAHDRGLAVGLKNDPTQLPDLLPWLDFAVVEQCGRYDECDLWQPLSDAGLGGVDVEYADDGDDLDAATAALCPDVPAGLEVLVKHLDLGPERATCVNRAPSERTP